MGAGDGGFDLVGQAVGIGGEKDVRHSGDGTRRPDDAHVPAASAPRIGGYHAARA